MSDAVLWESCGLLDSMGVEETELSIFLCVCDLFVSWESCGLSDSKSVEETELSVFVCVLCFVCFYTDFGERDFQEIVIACFPCLFSCKCLFVSFSITKYALLCRVYKAIFWFTLK